MKLVLSLFMFLFVQVSASFYGQFRGAMSNVERGFGKLLGDVVHNVKDTLHCTISAVEEVLAMNGLLEQTSDFNNRCRGYVKPKNIPKARDSRHRSFFDKHFQNNQPTKHLSFESELEHISQDLESSILNVNKSINDILRRREANSNFNSISELLKDETDRLNAVSEILGRELENISINVRNEIGKLHISRKKPPGDTIWEDLEALHYLKGKSKNKTEINEIDNIIDTVVEELHVTPSEKVLSEDEKLEEIKKQLNKFESGKQNDQTTDFNTKEIVQKQINTDKDIKSFKDLAQNIMNNDNRLIANSNSQLYKREATSQNANADKSLFDGDMAVMDSSSPFYNPNPIDDSKKIVEEAKSIMEESKKSEELINSFFKDHQQSNTDVFSNPNMFNFG